MVGVVGVGVGWGGGQMNLVDGKGTIWDDLYLCEYMMCLCGQVKIGERAKFNQQQPQ